MSACRFCPETKELEHAEAQIRGRISSLIAASELTKSYLRQMQLRGDPLDDGEFDQSIEANMDRETSIAFLEAQASVEEMDCLDFARCLESGICPRRVQLDVAILDADRIIGSRYE